MEEKRYTKKEIEEMFMEAQSKAICNLSEKFKEVVGEKTNGMSEMVFSMQNMVAIAEVYTEMFKEVE